MKRRRSNDANTELVDRFLENHSLEELYAMDRDDLLLLYQDQEGVFGVMGEAIQLVHSYESIQTDHKRRKGGKRWIDAFSKEVTAFSILVLALTKAQMYGHAEACSRLLQLVQNHHTQLVYIKQKNDSNIALYISFILWALSTVLSLFLARGCDQQTSQKKNELETKVTVVDTAAVPVNPTSPDTLVLVNEAEIENPVGADE